MARSIVRPEPAQMHLRAQRHGQVRRAPARRRRERHDRFGESDRLRCFRFPGETVELRLPREQHFKLQSDDKVLSLSLFGLIDDLRILLAQYNSELAIQSDLQTKYDAVARELERYELKVFWGYNDEAL